MPGQPQVARDRGRRTGERAGRAAVQQAAAGEARLLVDERAQLLMPEVVVVRALADQPVRHELFQAADRLLVAATARRAHRVDVERPPDHRRGGEHLPARLADRVQPRAQHAAGAGRQRELPLGVERAKVLDEQERHALGLFVQPPPQAGLRVGPRGPEQLADIVCSQPREPSHRAVPGALGLGDDPPHGVLVRRAPREHDEQRASREAAQAVAEQAERRVVGPVRVVDEQDPRRRGRGERVPHALVEARPRRRRVDWQRRVPELGQQAGGLGQCALRETGEPPVVIAQPAPQRLDQRSVGERRLLLVGPARQHRGAALACVRDQLLGEARLADAGLALDQRDAPVGADAAVQLDQRGAVGIAADERDRAGGRRSGRRRARRLRRPLADRLVEPRRLLERRHAQLARQHADTVAVLGERRRTVAAGRIEADQRAVRRLVEGVELQPPARMGERARPLDEPAQHAGQLAPQRVGLAALPVLEGRRVAQSEALEEVAAEDVGRGLQLAGGGQRTEARHVDLDGRSERHAVARRLESLGADRRAHGRERAPQGAARVLGVTLRPQQLGEHVARAGPAAEGQIGEQGDRLAGVERDRPALARHARRPEQHHGDGAHRPHRNDFRTAAVNADGRTDR